ncbi:Piso0_005571 [Millerozyma farinosa CBS 7064]|uniref:Piso0_005571 protein n=1 Tax=Pichia sorbitophila (strain ATCC MYA-4447 / BCRC 22081 / CBS 7064 / NBRC 10061 / NRRL Y-12695) TaxID=559304 RepID=G8XZC7_PICSO|nr:Piso0_005571 [Millerozyma farinosa CBS 7064]
MNRTGKPLDDDDDIASNFSFAKSEDISVNRPEKKDKRGGLTENEQIHPGIPARKPPGRAVDRQSTEYTGLANALNDFRIDQPSRSRYSHISNVSQYSLKEKQVAQPVSVTVVNQEQGTGAVQRTQSEKSTKKPNIIKIGKLKTETPVAATSQEPAFSFSTSIENSIPPRSSKRPQSEILPQKNELLAENTDTADTKDPSAHRKHTSMVLGEDLDKLMESAISLSSGSITSKAPSGKLDPKVPSQTSRQISYSSSNKEQAEDPEESPILNRIDPDHFPSQPLQKSRNQAPLPPRPSAEDLRKARQISSQLKEKELQNTYEVLTASQANIPPPAKSENPPSPTDQDQYEDEGPESPLLGQQAGNRSSVVKKPSRGKSVKDSTRVTPKHQHKKAKAKRVKEKRSSGLKPFSYHTIISLLESTNGTVIGEEFDQLNLPIKEKQLIEKIINSLSKLSSDMIIDETRYEIGISRLENALRALEGFI